jgi:hypothetical protein
MLPGIYYEFPFLESDKQDCWFQQDGAMAHTTNSAMQMLSKFFGGHISRNLWPPRSLDLSPPDFYLVVFEGECAQKQPPARIRRFETKY